MATSNNTTKDTDILPPGSFILYHTALLRELQIANHTGKEIIVLKRQPNPDKSAAWKAYRNKVWKYTEKQNLKSLKD